MKFLGLSLLGSSWPISKEEAALLSAAAAIVMCYCRRLLSISPYGEYVDEPN